MNTAIWNSEPLFTAFACSETEEDTIVETVEDGVTIIRADEEETNETPAAIETVELGNVIPFSAVAANSENHGSWRGMDKSQVWLIRELDGLAPKSGISAGFCCDELAKLSAARAWALRSAGTPLFLAA